MAIFTAASEAFNRKNLNCRLQPHLRSRLVGRAPLAAIFCCLLGVAAHCESAPCALLRAVTALRPTIHICRAALAPRPYVPVCARPAPLPAAWMSRCASLTMSRRQPRPRGWRCAATCPAWWAAPSRWGARWPAREAEVGRAFTCPQVHALACPLAMHSVAQQEARTPELPPACPEHAPVNALHEALPVVPSPEPHLCCLRRAR